MRIEKCTIGEGIFLNPNQILNFHPESSATDAEGDHFCPRIGQHLNQGLRSRKEGCCVSNGRHSICSTGSDACDRRLHRLRDLQDAEDVRRTGIELQRSHLGCRGDSEASAGALVAYPELTIGRGGTPENRASDRSLRRGTEKRRLHGSTERRGTTGKHQRSSEEPPGFS